MEGAKENVYLEIINKVSKAQVLNDTLQSVSSPAEVYPRGITVDPINEYVFVTWADYDDLGATDEPNRASYDRSGTQRWINQAHPTGYDHVGGVAYDIQNDQLFMGGGSDAFGETNESITKVSASTGNRVSGSTEPSNGAVVLSVQMCAVDDGVFFVDNGASTLFRYPSSLSGPATWSLALASGTRVVRSDYVYGEASPATSAPTTPAPTSPPPTTVPPTAGPTTPVPSTAPELTFPDPLTTLPPTTVVLPTTAVPTTAVPTTPSPTSFPGTTEPPTTDGEVVDASISYVPVMDQLVVRAWLKNSEEKLRDEDLDVSECVFELVDELGNRFAFRGVVDELGAQYARFVIPQARLFSNHVYVAEVTLVVDGGPTVGPSPIMLPVN